jgi:hypothetical protein
MPSLSNRSALKDTSSAHPSAFSDDEHATSNMEHSDHVGQAVERKSPKQKSNSQSREKDEQSCASHRSLSANSSTHIRLIDDKSLDSTSDNNTKLNQHGRRTKAARKNESVAITDPINDAKGPHHDSSSDELGKLCCICERRIGPRNHLELTAHQPLKATKPMSEQLHSTRERASSQQTLLISRARSTPTVSDTEKQSKDPMNVNITVVIKNASDDENVRLTTAEAVVDQERSGMLESSSQRKRSRSIDPSTQADTAPAVTQKHSRPKHISRTSQTYECVFRRMERGREHPLRVKSATEHSVPARTSQVRSRNRSPKKYLSPYLSADPVRYCSQSFFLFSLYAQTISVEWKKCFEGNTTNREEIQ